MRYFLFVTLLNIGTAFAATEVDFIAQINATPTSCVCNAYVCGMGKRNRCGYIYGAKKSTCAAAKQSLIEVCHGGCGSQAVCWPE